MLPNHFVIIWDNLPVADKKGEALYKTTDPNEVRYYKTEDEAMSIIELYPQRNWYIVLIQFRIV